jgi:hypothetical protein
MSQLLPRCLSDIRWQWTEPTRVNGAFLPPILEAWHRGHLLGMEICRLELDGRVATPNAIERLNYWLKADGAWRASLLSHFEAEKVLKHVMQHRCALCVGQAGGGRWATGTTAEKLLWDGCDAVRSTACTVSRDVATDKRRS